MPQLMIHCPKVHSITSSSLCNWPSSDTTMPSGPGKATVKADIGKNRLVFTLSGWLAKKDLDNLYTDVRFCVADLKPGFHVITDLSACSFGSLNGLATYRRIMNFLMEKQAGQVVRITRGSSLIHKQIMNFSARMQGYKPLYAHSFAEAEKLLTSGGQQQELRFVLHQIPAHFQADGVRETGYILEISTDSCVIEFFSSALSPGQEIVLEFAFPAQDGTPQSFKIGSTITVIEEDHFTAQYIDLSGDRRQLLRTCLIRQAQQDPA